MKYRVTISMDDNGWWFAKADDVAGAHSQGQTLARARANIREAIAAVLDLPPSAEKAMGLVENIDLPGDLTTKLARAHTIRGDLQRLTTDLGDATDEVLAALDAYLPGLGLRDKAELLGVSFQRIQQLQPGTPRRGRRPAPAPQQ